MKRLAACCVLSIAVAAATAHSSSVTLSGSGGPAPFVGEGASQFTGGRWFQLDATGRGMSRHEWIVRVAHERIAFTSQQDDAAAALQFFNGGRLYLPNAFSAAQMRQTSLEMGLARPFGAGRIRPRIEALAGASWTDGAGHVTSYRNDRKPDPSLSQSAYAEPNQLVPTLTLGAGVEVTTVARIGLIASAAAHWVPTRAFNGTVMPIRFGAAWPVEPASRGAESSALGPRLRLSAGTNFLRNPAALRGDVKPSSAFTAEIVQPLTAGLALSLEGDQMSQRDGATSIARQAQDSLGNLVNVSTAGSAPLSLTLTAVTVGLRLSRPLGAVTVAMRGGAGWGRTGGFGSTESRVVGVYDDGRGSPQIITQNFDLGAGALSTGFAYSASVGLDARLRGPISAFVEGGALGLARSDADLFVIPLRLGVTIR